MNPNPTLATHIASTEDLPDEGVDLAVGRPDAPTPSLWQRGVRCTHKVTRKVAVVHRIDWATNMFRAFYPSGGVDEHGKPAGRFSERTEWEHCRDWDVDVTLSPAEMERQASARRLAEEIATLDAHELGLVTVLCDDSDPNRALAKLEAMRSSGLIKGRSEAVIAAVAEVRQPRAPRGKSEGKQG